MEARKINDEVVGIRKEGAVD